MAVIALCAVATVATAGACGLAFAVASGALKGALIGAALGTAGGAVSGAASGAMAGAAKYAKNPSGYCFVAGTLVLTTVGLVSIETIKPGDMVYAKEAVPF